jgi:hypothetical protein
MQMDSSDPQEPPKQLEFRMEESNNFYVIVNGRHLTWLARLLRPIERPVYRWLMRRQERRSKASNRSTT